MSEGYFKAPFNPKGFYPVLALIRIPHDVRDVTRKPGLDDDFGTGFFVTKEGTLFTVAHNLTENGKPDGQPLPWVWVFCYNAATRDWTDKHFVEVDPNLIEPNLDAAILQVQGAPASLGLTADWRLGDSVVVLGFQPVDVENNRVENNRFVVRPLFCEIPRNWPVAPFDLKDVDGEPVLRLGMTLGQQPLGEGISGGPVL